MSAVIPHLVSGIPSPPREDVATPVLRNILFPTDLSPRSDRAFDHAKVLAERFGARVTLYHLVSQPDDPHGALGREVVRRAVEASHQHLEHRAEHLSVAHELVVEPHATPHRALVERIRRTLPDLTVMATHGREGVAHLVLGSVTEQVLHERLGPVLCVREPDHGVALPYRRILVPTDLSPASRRAFPMAALLARAFGAEVLVLHVARLCSNGSLSGIPKLVESSVPEEAMVRRFLGPAFDDVRLAVQVQTGPPWDRIIETAAMEKADVVVMSTHGHDSVADRVLGSHTERVARHASCPVLVV